MLKTGSGEFTICSDNGSTIFYKTGGKFFKDIFNGNLCKTPKSIEITKDEFLRKLTFFRDLIKNERN